MRALALIAVLITALAAMAATPAAPVAQEAAGDSNLGYMLAAFLAVWAGLFAYAFYMGRRGRELEREVEELRRGGPSA
jgi:CcmD family protein